MPPPDPQRDNFGLYALKCDRNAAKRGLVLNIASVQRRLSPDNKKHDPPCEMNHEKFEPVAVVLHQQPQLRREEVTVQIKVAAVQNHHGHRQPPPRRKRKSILGSQDTLHSIPAVPLDECVTNGVELKDSTAEATVAEIPARSANVKEMCRQFERQESVDIFKLTPINPSRGQFEDFDNIFGPSPTREAKDKHKGTVGQLRDKFSSTESFGSPTEDYQYIKRTNHVIKRQPTPVQVTIPVGGEATKSKVDKIVFADKFVPNSFEPPISSSRSNSSSSSSEITTKIKNVDFEKAFPDANSNERPRKTLLQQQQSHSHHHDQLTISSHYLNEDMLVWTF